MSWTHLFLMCVTVAEAQKVCVDPTKLLSIGGAAPLLDRAQYFNVHAVAGSDVQWRPQDVNEFAGQRAAHLGRGFDVSYTMSQAAEDPDRPGYVDVDGLMSYCLAHVQTLGGWPAAQVEQVQGAKTEQVRRT